MEANEARELQEHAEHAEHERTLRPVALTMTILAVLVAVVTVLGHRTHTEAVLTQNKATDQWNYYQAHKIRSNDTALAADLLSVVNVADKDAAKKLAKSYADHQQKWAENLKDEQEQAEALEAKVEKAEARADRFDLGEVLLEIGLVITSITLLTRRRAYWFAGLGFSAAGIVAAVLGLMLR
jgi:ribosome-binding ATPase YchF (GTP1/OBG family)